MATMGCQQTLHWDPKILATLLHNNILLLTANFMKHATFQACAML